MSNSKFMVRRGDLVVVKTIGLCGFCVKTVGKKPTPNISAGIPIPANFPGIVMDIHYDKINGRGGSKLVILYYLVLFGGDAIYVKPEFLSAI